MTPWADASTFFFGSRQPAWIAAVGEPQAGYREQGDDRHQQLIPPG